MSVRRGCRQVLRFAPMIERGPFNSHRHQERFCRIPQGSLVRLGPRRILRLIKQLRFSFFLAELSDALAHYRDLLHNTHATLAPRIDDDALKQHNYILSSSADVDLDGRTIPAAAARHNPAGRFHALAQ